MASHFLQIERWSKYVANSKKTSMHKSAHMGNAAAAVVTTDKCLPLLIKWVNKEKRSG